MNTKFVETFVTLCRLRSFRATADVLHATPAAISMRIKALEDDLRVALIDRTAPMFRLTPHGEGVLAHARKLLDSARALEHFARSTASAACCLRIGVVDAIVHTWLADYLRAMHERYPQVEIELTVDASENLRTRLLACELDLAIHVHSNETLGLASTCIATHSLEWVARSGWLGEVHDRFDMGRALPMVLHTQDVGHRSECEHAGRQLAALIGSPGAIIKPCTLPSIALMIRLLREGVGIGILPNVCTAPLLDSAEFEKVAIYPEPQPLVVALSHARDANDVCLCAAVAARSVSDRFCLAVGAPMGNLAQAATSHSTAGVRETG